MTQQWKPTGGRFDVEPLENINEVADLPDLAQLDEAQIYSIRSGNFAPDYVVPWAWDSTEGEYQEWRSTVDGQVIIDIPDPNIYLHDDWGDNKLQNREDSGTTTYNGDEGVYRPEWIIDNNSPRAEGEALVISSDSTGDMGDSIKYIYDDPIDFSNFNAFEFTFSRWDEMNGSRIRLNFGEDDGTDSLTNRFEIYVYHSGSSAAGTNVSNPETSNVIYNETTNMSNGENTIRLERDGDNYDLIINGQNVNGFEYSGEISPDAAHIYSEEPNDVSVHEVKIS